MAMTRNLGVPQLGRMCCTCRSWRAAALDDDVWAHLCHTRWANTKKIPRTILATKGHRWLYAQRSKTVQQLSLPPLVPPTPSTESLILLVDITLAGVPRVSAALAGVELAPLLMGGTLRLPLADPICLGEARLDADGEFKLDEDPENLDWDASAHQLRTTDDKVACIFSHDHTVWDYGTRIGPPPEGLNAENIDWEALRPEPATLELNSGCVELSDEGAAMAQRIEDPKRLFFVLEANVKQPRDARSFGFKDMLSDFRRALGGRPLSIVDRQFHRKCCQFWSHSGPLAPPTIRLSRRTSEADGSTTVGPSLSPRRRSRWPSQS